MWRYFLFWELGFLKIDFSDSITIYLYKIKSGFFQLLSKWWSKSREINVNHDHPLPHVYHAHEYHLQIKK